MKTYTYFLNKDVKTAKEYFGTDDVYRSIDFKTLKVFTLVIPQDYLKKAMRFASVNGHNLFILEAEDRKGIEICFRHKYADNKPKKPYKSVRKKPIMTEEEKKKKRKLDYLKKKAQRLREKEQAKGE